MSAIDGAYETAVSPPTPTIETFGVQMSEFGLIPTGPMSTKVPDSMMTPPFRTRRRLSVKVTVTPLQSTTMSAPRPLVSPHDRSDALFDRRLVDVIDVICAEVPGELQRLANLSVAIILPAPVRRAFTR